MAHEPYVPGLAPEAIEQSNAAKAQALRKVLAGGLLGLGSGAALAAVLGLPHALSRKAIPSYPLQTEIDLPYPQEVVKEKAAGAGDLAAQAIAGPAASGALEAYLENRRADRPDDALLRGGLKGLLTGAAVLPASLAGSVGGAAGGEMLASRFPRTALRLPAWTSPGGKGQLLLPKITAALGSGVIGGSAYLAARPHIKRLVDRHLDEKKADWADALASTTLSPKPGAPVPTVGTPAWSRGDSQTSWSSIPWALPAAAGAAAGGAYGGHQLVRYLLRKKRKAELDKDLQAAQKEYEESMLSQYDPAKLRSLTAPKEAAAPTTALDFCFTEVEKAGFDVNSLLGTGAGLYGVGALGLGTASGVATYKWMQGRAKHKLLRDALKRRAFQRSLQNPPDMYVRAVPVEYEREAAVEK